MFDLLDIVIFIIFGHSLIFWTFYQLVVIFLKWRYNCILKLGRCMFNELKFEDVQVITKVLNIHIEEVVLKISLTFPNLNNLLSISIKGARIELYLNGNSNTSRSIQEIKLPRSITYFSHFSDLRISGLLFKALPIEEVPESYTKWFYSAEAKLIELKTKKTKNQITFYGGLNTICLKLLEKSISKPVAEIVFNTDVEIGMLKGSQINFEKLKCHIVNRKIELRKGIHSFLQENIINLPMKISMHRLLHCIAQFKPKNFSFSMINCNVIFLKEHNQFDCLVKLQNIYISTKCSENEEMNFPRISSALLVSKFKIIINHEEIFHLNRLEITTKFIKEVLNISSELNVLKITYIHNDIYEWIRTCISQNNTDLATNYRRETWIKDFCDKFTIQGCASLRNISLQLESQTHTSTMAIKSLQTKFKRQDSNFVVKSEVDLAWFKVGDVEPSSINHHSFGTGFFLGFGNLEWNNVGSVNIKLNHIRFEQSSPVNEAIIYILLCFTDYTKLVPVQNNEQTPGNKMNLNLSLRNINIFVLTQEDLGVLCRIDRLSINQDPSKDGSTDISMKSTKIARIKPSDSYVCKSTGEMDSYVIFAKLVKCSYDVDTLKIQFVDELDVKWTREMHLECLMVVRKMEEFKNNVCDVLEVEVDSQPLEDWSLNFNGSVNLQIQFSDCRRHHLLNFNNLAVKQDSHGFSVVLEGFQMMLQYKKVLSIETVYVQSPLKGEIKTEKLLDSSGKEFELDWDRTWTVEIPSIKLYSSVAILNSLLDNKYRESFMDVIKWFKTVHNIETPTITIDTPPPSNFHINISDLSISKKYDKFLESLVSTSQTIRIDVFLVGSYQCRCQSLENGFVMLCNCADNLSPSVEVYILYEATVFKAPIMGIVNLFVSIASFYKFIFYEICSIFTNGGSWLKILGLLYITGMQKRRTIFTPLKKAIEPK